MARRPGAASPPSPPNTKQPLGGQCPPQGPGSLKRGAKRSHVCTLPSRPAAKRRHAKRREPGGSANRDRAPVGAGDPGRQLFREAGGGGGGGDALSVVGGNCPQIEEETKTVENARRLVPTSELLETTPGRMRGLHGGPREQLPIPRNLQEVSPAFRPQVAQEE